MKINLKNLPILISFLILGTIIGSLAWEVLERIIHLVPQWSGFSLTVKEPLLFFDFYVLAVYCRVNPGTLIGFLGGIFIFFLS